jgi:hypothetical protein
LGNNTSKRRGEEEIGSHGSAGLRRDWKTRGNKGDSQLKDDCHLGCQRAAKNAAKQFIQLKISALGKLK